MYIYVYVYIYSIATHGLFTIRPQTTVSHPYIRLLLLMSAQLARASWKFGRQIWGKLIVVFQERTPSLLEGGPRISNGVTRCLHVRLINVPGLRSVRGRRGIGIQFGRSVLPEVLLGFSSLLFRELFLLVASANAKALLRCQKLAATPRDVSRSANSIEDKFY